MLEPKAIGRLSPVVLPEKSSVRRNALNPEGIRNAAYKRHYDFTTVFYDVFAVENRIFLSGPPLLNLRDIFAAGTLQPDVPTKEVLLQDWEYGTQHSHIVCETPPGSLTISNPLLNVTLPLVQHECSLFTGKNVLFAMIKNHRLSWIETWARYYRDMHRVNALVLYDNASDAYSLEELFNTVSAIPGIEAVRVLSVPFSPGPLDDEPSAFLLNSMLEHARHRYLAWAGTVIHANVDELLVSRTGVPIPDALQFGNSPFITYDGLWIENILLDQQKEPSFANFGLMCNDTQLRFHKSTKWSLIPSNMLEIQWTDHNLCYKGTCIGVERHPDFFYLHFKGINPHAEKPSEAALQNIAELYRGCQAWLKIKDAY